MPKTETKPTDASQSGSNASASSAASDLLSQVVSAAEKSTRDDGVTVLYGPYEVGKIGTVDIVEKPVSRKKPEAGKIVCARFNSGAMIPLAAAKVAIDRLAEES